jgi:hypothetical protein
MKREQLIRTLMNASELEEDHTPVVARFLLEDFSWGPIPQDKVDMAKSILREIKKQTMEHQKIISGLIGYVQESGKDEF